MQKYDVRMRGYLKRTPVNTLLSLVKNHSHLLTAEDIPTFEASGRILAEEIISPANVPDFDRLQWMVMHLMQKPHLEQHHIIHLCLRL